MTADLVMARTGGGAIFEICATQNSIFAVAVANFEDGFLNAIFATQVGKFLGFLLFKGGVIGEKIGL